MQRVIRFYGFAFSVVAFMFAPTTFAVEPDTRLAERVDRLVRQLNDAQADRRDDAESSLLELVPADPDAADAFLRLLPDAKPGMPEEVVQRVGRIRREIEIRQATRAISPSRLTLHTEEMQLVEVLEQIAQQTGNRLVDHRGQFGQDSRPRTITVDIDDLEFWPAIDRVLDSAQLNLYPFSGEEALAIVNREEGLGPRVLRASYAGPFRVEATSVEVQRDLRFPAQHGARVELEIAWEPRLRPIAISQPTDTIEVTADDGSNLALANEQAALDVEVQSGSHATRLTIPLEAPPRSVSNLATFRGVLSALVPGRVVEFRFEQLNRRESAEQQQGGVKVTLQNIRKNQDLWEVHMRLRVESEEAGLQSHRGWAFQNLTYLLNKNDEVIDHAGLETTMQSEREIGLAYFFELPDDKIEDYTWVYRTPAAIVRVPVAYELKQIPLP